MGPQHWLAPFVYRVTASCDLCHLPRWLSAPPEPSPHAAWRVPGTSAAPPMAPHSPQNTLVHSTGQAEPGAGSGHSPGPGRVRGKRRPCQLLAHLPQGHGAELWLISETRFQDRQRPGEESKIPAFPGLTPCPPVMLFPDARPANLGRDCHLPGAPGPGHEPAHGHPSRRPGPPCARANGAFSRFMKGLAGAGRSRQHGPPRAQSPLPRRPRRSREPGLLRGDEKAAGPHR